MHHHLIRHSQLALNSSITLLVNLKYLLHVTTRGYGRIVVSVIDIISLHTNFRGLQNILLI